MADNTKDQDNPGYETTDANTRLLLYSAIALTALMAVSLLGVIPLLKTFKYYQPLFDAPVSPMAQERVVSDAPRLIVDTASPYSELRVREEAILNSYSWIDPDLKIVRIPIDRTISLVSSGFLALPKAFNDKPVE
jgi:hypothetical protein